MSVSREMWEYIWGRMLAAYQFDVEFPPDFGPAPAYGVDVCPSCREAFLAWLVA